MNINSYIFICLFIAAQMYLFIYTYFTHNFVHIVRVFIVFSSYVVFTHN